MNGQMEAARPRISILMAVYDPRMDWLREQLNSLNEQTYPNLKLFVRDDCSPKVPFGEICACVEECITAFPFEIARNEKNLGSNGTFERLTLEADGEYFAYCDQDDVWLPEKLDALETAMEREQAELVCSDLSIIDGQGNHVADKFSQVRKIVYRSGSNLAGGLLFDNFVTGCTMLVRAETAKAAAPFCPYMVHDHYLALWCAAKGNIWSDERALIRYRIHGANQTGAGTVLRKICDGDGYRRERMEKPLEKMEWLRRNFPCGEDLRQTMDENIAWLRARIQNWSGHGGGATVLKYMKFGPRSMVAEVFFRWLPRRWILKLYAVRFEKNHKM